MSIGTGVVEPFETLVVKARTKIAFTTGHLRCSTLAMDSKDGTLPPGLLVIGAYTVLKRGARQYPLFYVTRRGRLSPSGRGRRLPEYRLQMRYLILI